MKKTRKVILILLIGIPVLFNGIQLFNLDVSFVSRTVWLLLLGVELLSLFVAMVLVAKHIQVKKYKSALLIFAVMFISLLATFVFLVNDAFGGKW